MISKTHHSEVVNIDEKTLWLHFIDGDKKAYECIYRNFVQNLFNYGMKLNPNRSLVKDCIQELFVELWNRKERLSATDNIKFYLYKSLKIKLNHALKKDLRSKSGFSISSLFPHQFVKSYEQLLIEDQISNEKESKLIIAMGKLPARQREALNLLFFENLSYEQVSEIMSINVSSAYTLAWKAIGSLKKAFKEMAFILFLFIN